MSFLATLPVTVIAALSPLHTQSISVTPWSLQEEFDWVLYHMRSQGTPAMLGYRPVEVSASRLLGPLASLVEAKLPPNFRGIQWTILFKARPAAPFQEFLGGDGRVFSPLFTSPPDFYVRLQQAHVALGIDWPDRQMMPPETRLLSWESSMREIALAYGLVYRPPEHQTFFFQLEGKVSLVCNMISRALGLSLY